MAEIETRKARENRHSRVRAKVKGFSERPRLCVFRSLSHIYAQIIDDTRGHTLAFASTLDREVKVEANGKIKMEKAGLVGALMAKRALEKGIEQVIFDRGGYKYHGRVKALAEAARQGGLKF
jgi:large subunit ribosomal protein L18